MIEMPSFICGIRLYDAESVEPKKVHAVLESDTTRKAEDVCADWVTDRLIANAAASNVFPRTLYPHDFALFPIHGYEIVEYLTLSGMSGSSYTAKTCSST